MPLTALRELTLPTQKALTSRDQKTFLWRFHYSIEVGLITHIYKSKDGAVASMNEKSMGARLVMEAAAASGWHAAAARPHARRGHGRRRVAAARDERGLIP